MSRQPGRMVILTALLMTLAACTPPASPADVVGGASRAPQQGAAAPDAAEDRMPGDAPPGDAATDGGAAGQPSAGFDSDGLPMHGPDELIYGIQAAPASLLPLIANDPANSLIAQFIYSDLLVYDEQLQPVCDLCESFAATEQGRVWTFVLRPGIRFHDGAPLTARDVDFTYRAAHQLRGLPQLEQVEVLDDLTIRFTLRTPAAAFPMELWLPILPAHIWAALPVTEWGSIPQARQPVGSGPWQFSAYMPGQEIWLDANPMYYQDGPGVKRIRLWIYGERTRLLAAFAAGRIDVLAPTPEEEEALRGQTGEEIQWYEYETMQVEFIGVNHNHPALSDVRVRQAIAAALDRPALARAIYGERAQVIDGPIPPASWAYAEPRSRHAYDPARARRLLAQARQRSLQLRLIALDDPVRRAMAEQIVQALQAVGMTVQAEYLTQEQILQRMSDGDFDLVLASRELTIDPDSISVLVESGRNPFGYGNPEVDERMADARTAANDDTRRADYARIQQIAAEDVPVIWLFSPRLTVAIHSRVVHMALSPLGPVKAWEWRVAG